MEKGAYWNKVQGKYYIVNAKGEHLQVNNFALINNLPGGCTNVAEEVATPPDAPAEPKADQPPKVDAALDTGNEGRDAAEPKEEGKDN